MIKDRYGNNISKEYYGRFFTAYSQVIKTLVGKIYIYTTDEIELYFNGENTKKPDLYLKYIRDILYGYLYNKKGFRLVRMKQIWKLSEEKE